jgi:hypothetical protein
MRDSESVPAVRHQVAGPLHRRWRGLLAGSAAFVLALLGLAYAAGPAAAANPSLSVNPSSGLTNGQTVTVSGTGWPASANNIFVVQCKTGATGASGCDTNTFKTTTTDASGKFSVSFTVTESFSGINCATTSCVINANVGANPNGTTASAPIHFASAGPSSSPPAGTSTAPGSGPTSTAAAGGGAAPSGMPTGANTGKGVVRTVPVFVVVAAALAGAFLLFGAGALVRRRVHAPHH